MANNLTQLAMPIEVSTAASVIQSSMALRPAGTFAAIAAETSIRFDATSTSAPNNDWHELTYTRNSQGVLVFDDVSLAVNPYGRTNIRNFGELVDDAANGRLAFSGALSGYNPRSPASAFWINQNTQKIYFTEDRDLYPVSSDADLDDGTIITIVGSGADFFE